MMMDTNIGSCAFGMICASHRTDDVQGTETMCKAIQKTRLLLGTDLAPNDVQRISSTLAFCVLAWNLYSLYI